MWARLKSFFTIALFTLLIWLAADLNVSEPVEFQVKIRLKASEPNQYLAFADHAGPMTFVVEMYGRRVDFKAFEDLLASTRVFDASPKLGSEPIRTPVLSRDIVGSVREIDAIRLRVRDVKPSTVDVRVDTYETVEMPVQPDVGDLDVNLKPIPGVSVRLPRFALDRLIDRVIRPDVEPEIRKHALAHPDESGFSIPITLSIPVEPGIEYSISPTEIRVEGVIESQTATVAKGPVIVSFLIPNEVQRRYVVEVKDGTELRPDVFVTGPKSQLDQLNPQDIIGLVEIRAAYMDVPGEERSAAVRFVLPSNLPGLRIAPASQNRIVDFKLVERPQSKAPDQQ